MLNTDEETRTTERFNNLKYVIIDDPISSIDDSKIIMMATKLVDIINRADNNLRILMMTHHALFYSVLLNKLKRDNHYVLEPYVLKKIDNYYKLDKQKETPFGYHLMVKEEIEKSIIENRLQKYHCNLIRSLLEKTATFLGYENWEDCIPNNDKEEFINIINIYSHGRLDDLEYKDIPEDQKKIVISFFNKFIEDYNWKKYEANS